MLTFLRDHNYKLSEHVTSNLALAIVTMMSSIFAYGFETSVLSTIQAMDAYEEQFGEWNPKKQVWEFTPSRLAYLNSFPLITYALGVFLASFVGERYGRKTVFISMNSICLVGVIVAYTGRNYTEALVGRLVINIHVGMEAWLVPMWTAEIVPSAIRGSMVGMYAFSHVLAAFIASVITDRTSKIEGQDSWLIPVACMFIFPSTALVFSWLIPESPRWLIRKGKFDKAVDNIYYIRSATKDYAAEEEARLVQEALNDTPTKGKWRELFQGTNNRRTWTGILASVATQITGQAFASNYGTIFLKMLNVMDPFTGTMIKRAGLLLGTIFVITMVDRIGRRNTSIIFGSLTASCLLIMGALGTVTPSNVGLQKGVLAMSIIFPCTYMIGFGSTMQVVKSEIPHTTLRDKSGLVFWTLANLSNFLVTFTLPYLLSAPYANLGARVGLIYGSISVATVVLIFLFVPEMKNRSLEEVNEMFEAKVPAWRAKDFVATGTNAAAIRRLENHERGSVDDKLGGSAVVVHSEEARK
ncbi:low-affinity glucose transporter HXT1 [Microdochium trichocladiopsis]|uniref:Low-affinity glucose transporter HXT1 n=1 Tax=Microdochium trichocladiopsis TaxID=1682393 RepID=A0A9P8Y3T4_9PEZI|nr:low-affinity glucose transporter HXT1 [Microdochium trichocladiopsis]KAH7026648.1 low-affinity glucose transporter HXT1 [Microdochium trichocladiopsis]